MTKMAEADWKAFEDWWEMDGTFRSDEELARQSWQAATTYVRTQGRDELARLRAVNEMLAEALHRLDCLYVSDFDPEVVNRPAWLKAALETCWQAALTHARGAQQEPVASMPQMRRAFRTTESSGPENRYLMVFRFANLEALHEADDEWIALRAALAASPAPDTHPDDMAVDRFADAMKAKLAKKRAEGRAGWEDEASCTQGYLSKLLIDHVKKGDPVDVGNLAMMLHQRGERICND